MTRYVSRHVSRYVSRHNSRSMFRYVTIMALLAMMVQQGESQCGSGKYKYNYQVTCGLFNCCKCNTHSCKSCQAGRYQNSNSHGSTSCKNCPQGWYRFQTGASSCNTCNEGTYQDQEGQNGCDNCETGKYNDQTVQTSCKSCPAGQYQDLTRESSCKSCPAGQYQNYGGQSGCKGCPTGRYQNSGGQSGCKSCPTGQYQNQNFKTSCKPCGAGYYQNQNAQSGCKSCGVGYYQNQNLQTGCKGCGAGYYQNQNGQTGCKSCYIGTYQNQNTQSGCKSCPTGQYQNQNTQTGCKNCPTGKYQNEYARGNCKDCAAGKFQKYAGQSSCGTCAAGKFSGIANTDCTQCAAGQVSASGQGSCSTCGNGKFIASDQSSCITSSTYNSELKMLKGSYFYSAVSLIDGLSVYPQKYCKGHFHPDYECESDTDCGTVGGECIPVAIADDSLQYANGQYVKRKKYCGGTLSGLHDESICESDAVCVWPLHVGCYDVPWEVTERRFRIQNPNYGCVLCHQEDTNYCLGGERVFDECSTSNDCHGSECGTFSAHQTLVDPTPELDGYTSGCMCQRNTPLVYVCVTGFCMYPYCNCWYGYYADENGNHDEENGDCRFCPNRYAADDLENLQAENVLTDGYGRGIGCECQNGYTWDRASNQCQCNKDYVNLNLEISGYHGGQYYRKRKSYYTMCMDCPVGSVYNDYDCVCEGGFIEETGRFVPPGTFSVKTNECVFTCPVNSHHDYYYWGSYPDKSKSSCECDAGFTYDKQLTLERGVDTCTKCPSGDYGSATLVPEAAAAGNVNCTCPDGWVYDHTLDSTDVYAKGDCYCPAGSIITGEAPNQECKACLGDTVPNDAGTECICQNGYEVQPDDTCACPQHKSVINGVCIECPYGPYLTADGYCDCQSKHLSYNIGTNECKCPLGYRYEGEEKGCTCENLRRANESIFSYEFVKFNNATNETITECKEIPYDQLYRIQDLLLSDTDACNAVLV